MQLCAQIPLFIAIPRWSKRHVQNAFVVILSAKQPVNRKSITVPVTFPSPAVFPFTRMRCNIADKKYICHRVARHDEARAALEEKMQRKFGRYMWLRSIITFQMCNPHEIRKIMKSFVFPIFTKSFQRFHGLDWTILIYICVKIFYFAPFILIVT